MGIKVKVGTAGVDTLIGTAGADVLYGLAGNDILRGGTGLDLLVGGSGSDILEGGAGADRLNGGADNDTFQYKAAMDAKGDTIEDFAVGDKIDFSAITHHFIGNQQFNGVAGEIRYDYQTGSSSIIYFSEDGEFYYEFKDDSDITNLQIDTNGDGEADASLIVKKQVNLVETALNSGILFTADNLVKTGTANGETLTGLAGNDRLSGLAGNDTLIGGEGKDKLIGGDGNDTLDGGFGRDLYQGGAGNDIFRFSQMDEMYFDVISDFTTGDQVFLNLPGIASWGKFIGDAHFSGESGQYRFFQNYEGDDYYSSQLQFDFDGDYQADAIVELPHFYKMLQESSPGSHRLVVAVNQTYNGTAGADNKTTGFGDDILNGLAGDDILNGSVGDDTLRGGDGNDQLIGGTGYDQLYGDNGNDTLWMVYDDSLTGGAGNDIFKIQATDFSLGIDWGFGYVNDFTAGDKIDFSALDADINHNGNQAFTFIGSNNFSGVEGQLRVYGSGDMEGDINGDGIDDFHLYISGKIPTAADLIL